MALTLEELKTLLAERKDEVDILELLGINSYDLVERFTDLIENNFEKLEEELEDF